MTKEFDRNIFQADNKSTLKSNYGIFTELTNQGTWPMATPVSKNIDLLYFLISCYN